MPRKKRQKTFILLQADAHPFVAGATFRDAWKTRAETNIKGLKVFVPDLDQLVAMKKAAGRPKDPEDLRVLEKLKARRSRQIAGKKEKGWQLSTTG